MALLEYRYFEFRKLQPPLRGIEPRPRRWKRRILATRPQGICKRSEKNPCHVKWSYPIIFSKIKILISLMGSRPPVQGIEPRPRRWERRILATRPHGIAKLWDNFRFCLRIFCKTKIRYPGVIYSPALARLTQGAMATMSPQPGTVFLKLYLKMYFLPCGESNPGRGGENAES